MKMFAIGDLHLSKSNAKAMDVFGDQWKDHVNRIRVSWLEKVSDDDIVLIPGDISWAMRLDEAVEDLSDIVDLPGKKVFIRGNHDYWWSSISKVRNAFCDHSNMYFLQGDSILLDDIVFMGTRGWICPGNVNFTQHDEKLYRRELTRMELSLRSRTTQLTKVVLMHFPPVSENHEPTGFTELFERYSIDSVVYGHLHMKRAKSAFEGRINGVNYTLVSSDYIKFSPVEIETQKIGTHS